MVDITLRGYSDNQITCMEFYAKDLSSKEVLDGFVNFVGYNTNLRWIGVGSYNVVVEFISPQSSNSVNVLLGNAKSYFKSCHKRIKIIKKLISVDLVTNTQNIPRAMMCWIKDMNWQVSSAGIKYSILQYPFNVDELGLHGEVGDALVEMNGVYSIRLASDI